MAHGERRSARVALLRGECRAKVYTKESLKTWKGNGWLPSNFCHFLDFPCTEPLLFDTQADLLFNAKG